MTAAQVLAELRRLGVQAQVESGRLRTTPAGAVPAALRPLLVAHRAELLGLVTGTCPECGLQDYLPLPAGWRRCWACGSRRGPGPDPGAPPDLGSLASLLGLDDARHPRRASGRALPHGAVVRVEQVDDAGHRAWQLQALDGSSVGAGLFASQARAIEHARAQGWRCKAAGEEAEAPPAASPGLLAEGPPGR